MTTAIDILRTVVGSTEIAYAEHPRDTRDPYFHVYDIALPLPAFRGVPPNWTVAVHARTHRNITSREDEEMLFDVAAHLVDRYRRDRKHLLLISDDPNVHLSDEFSRGADHVFCLDAPDIRKAKDPVGKAQLTPFVAALRRKLEFNAPATLAFSPYQRERPVSGWRFFGRHRELREIVGTNDNIVLVGARRVGKTSLMREAARQIEASGEKVYFVDVQNCTSAKQVVDELVRSFSERDAAKAIRHASALGEPVLSHILRRLTHSRATVFLDELGNVLKSSEPEDWSFFGTLRKYSQQEHQKGKLRIVFSCFQEVFLKQQAEFEGPLVNFVRTMRIGHFRPAEAEEFIAAPLELWRPLDERERRNLIDSALSVVGCHPYLLQYFCWSLFEELAIGDRQSLTNLCSRLLRDRLAECFSEAIEAMFFRIASPTLQYLFLERCFQADTQNQELRRTVIDDEWIERHLLSIGIRSTMRVRRNLLEGLEIHGLTTAIDGNRSAQFIAAPIVYVYVKRAEHDVSGFVEKLRRDIGESEIAYWGLEKSNLRK